MTIGRTLDSDPIDEARRQWVSHGWAEAADGMAAVESMSMIGSAARISVLTSGSAATTDRTSR